jgi:hypothetical protein
LFQDQHKIGGIKKQPYSPLKKNLFGTGGEGQFNTKIVNANAVIKGGNKSTSGIYETQGTNEYLVVNREEDEINNSFGKADEDTVAQEG